MIKTNFSVLIAERGLKIADVYEDTGISKTTLMALAENTGKGVQFDTVDKLCNYLGVELKDFFTYVPYTWKISFKTVSVKESKEYEYIVVNLKSKNSEKDYFLNLYTKTANSYDFPLDDESYKLFTYIDLDERDSYYEEDFYKFVKSLSVSMYSSFINELIDTLREYYFSTKNPIIAFEDIPDPDRTYKEKHIEVNLEKGDKIYLIFFGNTVSLRKEIRVDSTKSIIIK